VRNVTGTVAFVPEIDAVPTTIGAANWHRQIELKPRAGGAVVPRVCCTEDDGATAGRHSIATARPSLTTLSPSTFVIVEDVALAASCPDHQTPRVIGLAGRLRSE
jgi:hypothetical protein